MRLSNGTILPSGMMDSQSNQSATAFNKTHANYPIRAGIVVQRHELDDKTNLSKIAVEYDVIVIEQDRNLGTVPITYKNCLSVESLGAIGDFFEKKLRKQTKADKKTKGKDFIGQNGAIVLLMCLDGSSSKGIIVGSMRHPDRKTKLVGKGQILAGEFNGLAISVADDGSANLTFKGATDNEGKPIDAKQGNTTIDIEKDGTLQFKNKGVTTRMEKAGKVLLTAEDAVTITAKKDISVTTDANLKVKAKTDATAEMTKLSIKASGSATFEVGSFDLKSDGKAGLKAQMVDIQASTMFKVQSTMITLDGMVFLGAAGGTPAITIQTQAIAIGNLGLPLVTNFIGPFSTKVFLV